MAVITQSQYEAYISEKLGTPYTIPVNGVFTFNSYLKLYERQLMSTGFFSNNIVDDYVYDLECGKKFIPIPVFNFEDFEVYRVNIPSNTKTLLTINKDYRAKTFNYDGKKYYKSLDLTCLGCTCECDYFVVKGKKGFPFDEELLELLMNIIYNNGSSGGVSVGGGTCCANIQSKTLGGLSVNYKTNATTAVVNTQKIIKDSNFILSFPVIMQIVNTLNYYYIQY